MTQADRFDHVLERKGYKVSKSEPSENLDTIDVLRSDNVKGFTVKSVESI